MLSNYYSWTCSISHFCFSLFKLAASTWVTSIATCFVSSLFDSLDLLESVLRLDVESALKTPSRSSA